MGQLSKFERFIRVCCGWCPCSLSIFFPTLGPMLCCCPCDSADTCVPCTCPCACQKTVPACSYPSSPGWHPVCSKEGSRCPTVAASCLYTRSKRAGVLSLSACARALFAFSRVVCGAFFGCSPFEYDRVCLPCFYPCKDLRTLPADTCSSLKVGSRACQGETLECCPTFPAVAWWRLNASGIAWVMSLSGAVFVSCPCWSCRVCVPCSPLCTESRTVLADLHGS